jgi:methylamine---glutamate N-methyltransferase subunit C
MVSGMIYPNSQIWTPETISDIHARADGGYSLSGFRTFREIPRFDDLVFLAAGLSRFPLEGYKEKCRTETTLGPRSPNPLSMEVPIYVASSSSLSRGLRGSLALGSSLANTALSVGGGLLPEEKRVRNRLIYEVSPEERRGRPTAAIKAAAIQIDIDQMDVDALRELVDDVRKAQDQKTPILVRIGAGRVRDEVRAAVRAKADGVVLLGLETKVLSAPSQLRQYCRLPMVAAIPLAREALRESKALGEVSLIAGNGIVSGADAAKAIALGADAVAIQETALVALGASTRPARGTGPSSLSAQKGGELIANYINSIIMEVALLARSLGKGDVHSLEFEDLAALTLEASLISGVNLAGE